MKKTLALLLLLPLISMLLISCTEGEDTSTESTESFDDSSAATVISRPESISLVVLGDSIARGASLANAEAERYSALLEAKLKEDYKTVKVSNFGIDGQTGEELLASLKNSPAAELKECDYILVSIGGNNILQFLNSLGGGDASLGGGNASLGGGNASLGGGNASLGGGNASLGGGNASLGGLSPAVFGAYFKYIIAETDEEKAALQFACDAISASFKTLNATFSGEQFETLVKTAREKLVAEIPQIVSELKKINENAEIIIQTIYNPYRDFTVKLTDIEERLDLHTKGEYAVSELNKPITELAARCGYTVLDVHKEFNESIKTLTFAGLDVNKMSFSLDPHPNAKGHELIAQIYYDYFTEKNNG